MADLKVQHASFAQIEQSDIQKVKVATTDIDGILRGKYLNRDKFLSAANGGFGFCSVVFGWDCNDVCYDKSKLSGWHNGYPDVSARIDLNTFRRVPWDNNVPFYLADFETEDEKPLAQCPRQLLKKVIKRAEGLGYQTKFGLEFEWFNFCETPQSLAQKRFVSPEPITPGMFGYSILRQGQNLPFLNALMDELRQFDVPIEGLHTETGPGVLEAALSPADALLAADRAVLFKSSTKEIAHRFGIMASFMARWSNELPGCSGHIHQSLWKNGDGVFYNGNDANSMSDTFKHYLAGQLLLLPELLPLFAPNVNSYKRLVEGYWAPTAATWGVDNRTCALRVIKGNKNSTRLETRVPGSDINPYLAVAAALASGLYGIENKVPLNDAPTAGNAYKETGKAPFAKNLYEATEKLNNSKRAREILGDGFVDHFVSSRDWEWRQYQQAVTSYELERYFEII